MSPQFVDFDADGRLDIVAGIFDGSPHLVRGSAQGWLAPEQILDRDGARIVGSQYWDFDAAKWVTTQRCDPPGLGHESHLTSAIAFDVDGDGDLDLLLGDHRSGHVFVRTNEGSGAKPAFARRNALLQAGGRPIDVAGTVATLRLVDWNRDGRPDLACGSMGDPYGDREGGGVVVFVDRSRTGAADFGPALELLPRSRKGHSTPTRPDSGLYMDFADHDDDGDLDMVVGGYSHWAPPGRPLTPDERRRADDLKAQFAACERDEAELLAAIDRAVQGLDEAAADRQRAELRATRKDEFAALAKKRAALAKDLDALIPGPKRQSWVWLYENRAGAAPSGR